MRDTHPDKANRISLKRRNKELYAMIASLSLQRLSSISPHAEASMVEHPESEPLNHSHKTMIQVISSAVRITFASLFDDSESHLLSEPRRRPPKSKEQISDSTSDLFKEYNNLVAGGISRQLFEFGSPARISLPSAIRIEDDLASCTESSPGFSGVWRIEGEGFRLTCIVHVELLDDSMDQFKHVEEEEVESGELEML